MELRTAEKAEMVVGNERRIISRVFEESGLVCQAFLDLEQQL